MTFNKLLLVFTFAIISVIADHEWISSEIEYYIYEVQSTGSILFDNTTDDSMHGYVNVTDIPLLDASKDEKLDSFRLFEKNEFKDIEVVKGTNFNYEKCDVIKDAVDYSDYALFGLVAYLREKVNIIPSIAYAVEALPAEVKMKVADDDTYQDYFYNRGCSREWEQYTIGSQLGGIVSTECISNEATNIPGYKGGSSKTLPPKPTKCDDGTTNVKAYAEGFKYGWIENATIAELKQCLTRVGPVSRADSIILGWDESGWIMAFKYTKYSEQYGEVTYYTEETIPYDTDTQFYGSVFYYDCRYPSAETSAVACPCPKGKKSKEYKDDPRTKKGLACASGSVRMTLSMIAAAVIIPVLALFV